MKTFLSLNCAFIIIETLCGEKRVFFEWIHIVDLILIIIFNVHSSPLLTFLFYCHAPLFLIRYFRFKVVIINSQKVFVHFELTQVVNHSISPPHISFVQMIINLFREAVELKLALNLSFSFKMTNRTYIQILIFRFLLFTYVSLIFPDVILSVSVV